MNPFIRIFVGFFCINSFLLSNYTKAQGIDSFKFKGSLHPMENVVSSKARFNGYTNHWHNNFEERFRYGSLFKMNIPDVEYTIAQSKVDIAEDLRLPGLSMQEGFLDGLLKAPFTTLEYPSLKELKEILSQGNVLVFTHPDSETGEQLLKKLPKENPWKNKLKSYQYGSLDFEVVNAFYLEADNRKIFIVSSKDRSSCRSVKDLIEETNDLLNDYDLHKGWFGTKTLLKSVTCMYGHPLEVIGIGMNEGNTWFVFDGYMDFLMKDELEGWIARAGIPVVTDVGTSPIYGCSDYEGLQIQDTDKEAWINFAHEKKGYIFRPVYDPESDPYHYDGYSANEGNKKQIDSENVPFITSTGSPQYGAVSSMVLFIEKGEPLSREQMWAAIMDRREVAVTGQGRMMGPELYRKSLQMLLLDRVFLEEYYNDRINLEAGIEDYTLNISVSNTYSHAISGSIDISLPPELKVEGELSVSVHIPERSTKIIQYEIRPQPDAMDRTNPVVVHFKWGGKEKSTLTMLDMPPAISVHRLLYGHSPKVRYPVTIHNFRSELPFPVTLQVFKDDDPGQAVFEATQNCTAALGTFQDLMFNLDLKPGDYSVHVSALSTEFTSQLGVGKPNGDPYAYEVDLNSDGINEYRLENDSVQVTLLATGARIIEYIVKSRNDNVLFKLWPERPENHKAPFRERGYYAYGGFEDFLGQASMETHKIYDAGIVKKEGDFVRVRMVADYYGNKLEKVFTLYGNSPLLEIRFALTFKNPEANVIGPQPILELGKVHGTEDVFIVPAVGGLKEFRMRPEEYYGNLIHMEEGWNAGYDTKENISFVGAFPVSQPLFNHMWMNHPMNPDAKHYYVEFQPWTPIFQSSTMYFSYYLWGSGAPWKEGVAELEKRNLVTKRR